MKTPSADRAASHDKAQYPAQQNQTQRPQQHPMPPLVSNDERMARALQAQYDREAVADGPPPVLAQPGFDPSAMPFNCGHCGLPHVVRHATHNTVFSCARCGRQNQIVFQNSRPVVVMRSASWVPIPIFCNIQ